MRIVIFGAGGRAGRAAVAEARRRGHQVTAVVRDPARHTGLTADARVVAGDVTGATDVAEAAADADAAISAAADPRVPAHVFFTGSVRALATGLASAGVQRLLVVGLAPVLPGASGIPLMDEPGYPDAFRAFCEGHAAGLAALRETLLDWAYVAPVGDFDRTAGRTGRYRVGTHTDLAERISYPDLAVALLDEIERPVHRREAFAVGAV
ncbi:NAD(P)H-binding protein [Streptomyces sp. DSM 44915]|uniref:NAD(P)H-binding protein n=1 Tax=Streptomyces chisholmiae TaxID=3075540 RepID=A0ABU2JUC1_9ACTN|nr:NAD(P)H-binding protein [Streptomyces sp. DSM 44915]MDT0268507.1 NAD(P)H-binding protein [Streptomyces sp. DSM 44915]